MGDSQTKQFGDKYVGQLSDQLDKPAPFFNKSMFVGAGGDTRDAWRRSGAQATALDDSGGFGTGQRGAMDSLGDIFSGYGRLGSMGEAAAGDVGGQYEQLGRDYAEGNPWFEADLANSNDAAGAAVNSAIGASGRLGSSAHVGQLARTIGELDTNARMRQRDTAFGQRNAALQGRLGAAGAAFGMGRDALTGQTGIARDQFGMGQQALDNETAALGRLGAIGSARDANAQGARLGEADLYDRRNNRQLDRLLKIGSGFGGSAVDAANEAPWWQQLLGGALGLAGGAVKNWWS